MILRLVFALTRVQRWFDANHRRRTTLYIEKHRDPRRPR